MAITVADPTSVDPVQPAGGRVFGDVRVMVKRVTLDASYPTGGYTLPIGQGGMQMPGGVCYWADSAQVAGNETTLITPWWEPSTGQLKCYTDAGEVANATNLSTVIVQVVAYGK